MQRHRIQTGDHCGDSRSGYIHMKSENKHRIQQDIGQRAYDHREHADPWKALAGNEIVQAHGHKGEKVPAV